MNQKVDSRHFGTYGRPFTVRHIYKSVKNMESAEVQDSCLNTDRILYENPQKQGFLSKSFIFTQQLFITRGKTPFNSGLKKMESIVFF